MPPQSRRHKSRSPRHDDGRYRTDVRGPLSPHYRPNYQDQPSAIRSSRVFTPTKSASTCRDRNDRHRTRNERSSDRCTSTVLDRSASAALDRSASAALHRRASAAFDHRSRRHDRGDRRRNRNERSLDRDRRSRSRCRDEVESARYGDERCRDYENTSRSRETKSSARERKVRENARGSFDQAKRVRDHKRTTKHARSKESMNGGARSKVDVKNRRKRDHSTQRNGDQEANMHTCGNDRGTGPPEYINLPRPTSPDMYSEDLTPVISQTHARKSERDSRSQPPTSRADSHCYRDHCRGQTELLNGLPKSDFASASIPPSMLPTNASRGRKRRVGTDTSIKDTTTRLDNTAVSDNAPCTVFSAYVNGRREACARTSSPCGFNEAVERVGKTTLIPGETNTVCAEGARVGSTYMLEERQFGQNIISSHTAGHENFNTSNNAQMDGNLSDVSKSMKQQKQIEELAQALLTRCPSPIPMSTSATPTIVPFQKHDSQIFRRNVQCRGGMSETMEKLTRASDVSRPLKNELSSRLSVKNTLRPLQATFSCSASQNNSFVPARENGQSHKSANTRVNASSQGLQTPETRIQDRLVALMRHRRSGSQPAETTEKSKSPPPELEVSYREAMRNSDSFLWSTKPIHLSERDIRYYLGGPRISQITTAVRNGPRSISAKSNTRAKTPERTTKRAHYATTPQASRSIKRAKPQKRISQHATPDPKHTKGTTSLYFDVPKKGILSELRACAPEFVPRSHTNVLRTIPAAVFGRGRDQTYPERQSSTSVGKTSHFTSVNAFVPKLENRSRSLHSAFGNLNKAGPGVVSRCPPQERYSSALLRPKSNSACGDDVAMAECEVLVSNLDLTSVSDTSSDSNLKLSDDVPICTPVSETIASESSADSSETVDALDEMHVMTNDLVSPFGNFDWNSGSPTALCTFGCDIWNPAVTHGDW